MFHGCEDERIEQVRKPSRRLFEDFHAGRSTLVTSPVIARALRTAPKAVCAWLRSVPEENLEAVEAVRHREEITDNQENAPCESIPRFNQIRLLRGVLVNRSSDRLVSASACPASILEDRGLLSATNIVNEPYEATYKSVHVGSFTFPDDDRLPVAIH